MAVIATIDYLRLCRQFRRTLSVDIPAELLARKGKSSAGRARCRRLESALCEMVRGELKKVRRRPYRGEVAVHLELRGIAIEQAPRTVKAVLDAMRGPVYADDQAVALLDVSTSPGTPSASISTCSVGEYADVFDILSGAQTDADDREMDDADHPNPWAWAPEISPSAELDLEIHRENLAYAESDGAALPPDLRKRLIGLDRKWIREHELNALLATPFLPIDRPGPPSLMGRLWNDDPHLGGPASFVIPAPSGGAGSWSEIVEQSLRSHAETWRLSFSTLAAGPLAFDIAIGSEATNFDVDNLAHRVLKAFRRVVPDLLEPSSYRVYRRQGDDDKVVVRLHSPRRADDLRWLMSGHGIAFSGLRPDPDVTSHRRRPTDAALYERVRATNPGACE